jgi:hypothetical protein
MGVVRSFRELNVYQLSRDGAQRIFNLSKKFPIEERYSLTDQIRRSSLEDIFQNKNLISSMHNTFRSLECFRG